MTAPFRNAWRILKQGNPWEDKNVPRGWPYEPAAPAGTPAPNLHPMRSPQPGGGPWQPGEQPQRDPYPNPDLPFRNPEKPWRPMAPPNLAMQIAMIEAQIQELLQKKAALEAQSGGGGGEGGAPPPLPFDPPSAPPPGGGWDHL